MPDAIIMAEHQDGNRTLRILSPTLSNTERFTELKNFVDNEVQANDCLLIPPAIYEHGDVAGSALTFSQANLRILADGVRILRSVDATTTNVHQVEITADGILLHGMEIDGNRANHTALPTSQCHNLRITSCKDVRLTDCFLHDTPRGNRNVGIVPVNLETFQAENLLVDRCDFINAGWANVRHRGLGAVMRDCRFTYTDHNGTKTAITSITGGNTINATAHGVHVGDVVFFTGDTVPTGLDPERPYWCIVSNANDLQVSLTDGGPAVTGISDDGVNAFVNDPSASGDTAVTNECRFMTADLENSTIVLTGGSARCLLPMETTMVIDPAAVSSEFATTIAIGTTVTATGHNYTEGQQIGFNHEKTGASLPPEIAITRKYFVRNPTTNTFNISTLADGALISFSAASTGNCFSRVVYTADVAVEDFLWDTPHRASNNGNTHYIKVDRCDEITFRNFKDTWSGKGDPRSKAISVHGPRPGDNTTERSEGYYPKIYLESCNLSQGINALAGWIDRVRIVNCDLGHEESSINNHLFTNFVSGTFEVLDSVLRWGDAIWHLPTTSAEWDSHPDFRLWVERTRLIVRNNTGSSRWVIRDFDQQNYGGFDLSSVTLERPGTDPAVANVHRWANVVANHRAVQRFDRQTIGVAATDLDGNPGTVDFTIVGRQGERMHDPINSHYWIWDTTANSWKFNGPLRDVDVDASGGGNPHTLVFYTNTNVTTADVGGSTINFPAGSSGLIGDPITVYNTSGETLTLATTGGDSFRGGLSGTELEVADKKGVVGRLVTGTQWQIIGTVT